MGLQITVAANHANASNKGTKVIYTVSVMESPYYRGLLLGTCWKVRSTVSVQLAET